MSTDREPHREARLSRADAERLLANRAGTPAALSDLLDAAAAPSPLEPAGQSDALLAFRRAQLSPAPAPRRRSMLKSALANLVAVKVAATAATAAAAGGVALAAATGSLPVGLQDAAHSAFGAPAPHQHTVALADPTTSSTPDEPSAVDGTDATTTESAEASDSSAPTPTHLPSPSLVGLCHAFQAGATDHHGDVIDTPAFRALVTAAGGKDGVAAFCVTLIGPAPTHHAAPGTTEPHPQPPVSPSEEHHSSPAPTIGEHGSGDAPAPTPTHSETETPTLVPSASSS
jgi:hypothetical protein